MTQIAKTRYIKPTAARMAFCVRENIASSVGSEVFTEQVGGLTFTHALPRCNDYLNSTRIDTGLRDDCFDIDHVLQNLRDTAASGGEHANAAAELLHLLQTAGPEGFNCA